MDLKIRIAINRILKNRINSILKNIVSHSSLDNKKYNLDGENSLKQIVLGQPQIWRSIFENYMQYELEPNFCIYRKPYAINQD